MKNAIKNIKGNNLTTGTGAGTGLAIVLIFVAKMLKIDVGEVVGVDAEFVLLGLSSLISAIVNLIAKDPEKKIKE
jgi:hypothetical protein